MLSDRPLSRRALLAGAGTCAAHLALAAALAPRALHAAFARPSGHPVVAREPFGRLERVAPGVWALVSTPLGGDRTTLSNGGIVMGRGGVLVIEGLNTPAGAAWLAARARELTGRWPTHVVVTHYHADHANGVAGYALDAGGTRTALRATPVTRDLVLARAQAASPADAERAAAFRDAILVPSGASTLDLGGRAVRLVPRAGHTASDVTVELDEPGVVFAGDLVWHGMFPNYVDATPTRLRESVRALRRDDATTRYVPGHGSVGGREDLDRYTSVLDEVERAARQARAQGRPPAAAAAAFTLPASLGEWTLFNPAFFERAFGAWYREIEGVGSKE